MTRSFDPGTRVTLRPDRADAYGLPRNAVYTVGRCYPHKTLKRNWVTLPDAPANPDGTVSIVDSSELRVS